MLAREGAQVALTDRKTEEAEREAPLQELTVAHPIGHFGTLEDVAYGVLYLASHEAKFVIGAELVIDGGYTTQ
jgi:NAD(P)-dependent dehydrogenase (short-subunit alcohol dehydrogenase family)